MKTISEGYAKDLVNFAPTKRAEKMGFAESQLEGSVAAFNMLAKNGVAYIADEVGMGKTYVALAVMSLLRYQQPGARIVVIAPRENIQFKWIKELKNFVRDNWRHEDNRVKSLNGQPVRPTVACRSVDDIARVLQVDDGSDLFLRMTTFSIAVKTAERRKRYLDRMLPYVPWVDESLLKVRDPLLFRDNYGRVLNAIIPDIDLLVVDESHNLKKGFGEKYAANRNRVLGLAMGHPKGGSDECPWYGPRVKRLLMLSATPFEYDYGDLYHQLDLFGFGQEETTLTDGDGRSPLLARLLLDDDEETRRRVARKFLIRRVQYLKMGGKAHSKNMYRREWRRGGYDDFDHPIMLEDPKQRLVVGLIQKKVAEILGDRKFNNSFQIGMLSSFESFMETMSRSKRLAATLKEADENDGEDVVFDGNQDATHSEKQGVDSHSIGKVVRSYRDRFGHSLPHPKLDATAQHLKEAFATGDKALVFVRRIATVTELKGKLDTLYDQWMRRRMHQMLPALTQEIDGVFRRYEQDKRGGGGDTESPQAVDDDETAQDERAYELEDDEGGTESFFAWFFRGKGPRNILSGTAFQKNRLANVSSAYATFFEDNHVAWILGRPTNILDSLSELIPGNRVTLIDYLRQQAYAYFARRTSRKEGYPRLYVWEAYQFAGLTLIQQTGSPLAEQASVVLEERYSLGSGSSGESPRGFPHPEVLEAPTFFTELIKHEPLRERIWPDDDLPPEFRDAFRIREQRRELLSALARLGASFVDLYLLAIRGFNSFDLRADTTASYSAEALIKDYVDLLNAQMEHASKGQTFNSFYELSETAGAFDTLVSVNFPEIRDAPLADLAKLIGRTLQHQQPVGRMSGGVNKRLVKQFRMPGYPLVLATTDVLQEGEDLHTFCRRVIHYGITWTPSAMEQRTGRVDRIGSLVQRRLDGGDREPDPSELIQVHYPHLSDTVERLQVRRVLERLNKFIRLIHRTNSESGAQESRVDVAREILRVEEAIPRFDGLLESDFPVSAKWLAGDEARSHVQPTNLVELQEAFKRACARLAECLDLNVFDGQTRWKFRARAAIAERQIIPWQDRVHHSDYRQQPIEIQLRSQTVGDGILIRCISPVGPLDFSDDETVDLLYDLQRRLGMVRVCTHHNAKSKRYETSIESDRLFRVDATQDESLLDMVSRTLLAADTMEEELLGVDADSETWSDASEGGEDG